MPNPVEFPDKIQMDQDIIDVFLHRAKKLSDFPAEYQERLKAAYQFSASKFNSNEEVAINRTSDTLDII